MRICLMKKYTYISEACIFTSTIQKNRLTTLISIVLDKITKYDKKTLTIPYEFSIAAKDEGINFSQVLQAELMEKLDKTKSRIMYLY
jgi:hypothetical protein